MYNIWYKQEYEWQQSKTDIISYAFNTREEAMEYIRKYLTAHSITRAAVLKFEEE